MLAVGPGPRGARGGPGGGQGQLVGTRWKSNYVSFRDIGHPAWNVPITSLKATPGQPESSVQTEARLPCVSRNLVCYGYPWQGQVLIFRSEACFFRRL